MFFQYFLFVIILSNCKFTLFFSILHFFSILQMPLNGRHSKSAAKVHTFFLTCTLTHLNFLNFRKNTDIYLKGIPRPIGKHPPEVCSPLKRRSNVQWTLCLTHNTAYHTDTTGDTNTRHRNIPSSEGKEASSGGFCEAGGYANLQRGATKWRGMPHTESAKMKKEVPTTELLNSRLLPHSTTTRRVALPWGEERVAI